MPAVTTSDLGRWRAALRAAKLRLRDYVHGYFASEGFLPVQNSGEDFYANVKVEILPAESFGDDPVALSDNFDFRR